MSKLIQKIDTATGVEYAGKIQLDEIAMNIADVNFIYVQMTPATVWQIVHNLGKQPSVTIIDSAGTNCFGLVIYTDSNTLEVRFSAQFSGKAFLN